ncbi:ATP-binding protein [Pararhodobacter zhoushanensis]|uniref:histidine kinase n=1 Tax=Pararhodobacter zhoushanensis TaxID=2479545 RepID=A0ABT3H2E2_9RHOB|nr:ATP-binding protein [Pararhodobacter zhoushanensis]MCW1933910.1 ATP-binding protein [Pararhodobacter zhoushanensis]
MLGRLLKPFLPRGLFWRAALIVFVPVATILLVVSLAFIQRHYDGVTRQMTGNFVLVADHLRDEVDAAPDRATAEARAAALALVFDLNATVVPTAPPTATAEDLPFYDLSGRLAIRELERGLPEMTSVLLRRADVSLWMTTRYGQLQLDFGLGRISARNPHQMLVLTLVIGLGMGFVSFIYLKNQMRPMQRLARAAEAFGRGQTLPYRPAGATEVRAAGAAFLEMRERIERHIEQRTLLLSGISHDLRTPLTRMRLALSMFDDEPEAQALLADVAEMEALIDRFLDFTRSEAEEPVSPTDLGALVAQRVHEAARLGRSVDLIGAPEGPILPLRPQLLARAVDNLIGNALRYGRKARVSVTSAQGWAIISVEDDGPGIEPQHYDRAIRPFVRLDPARGASRGAGAGLGLAIVADAMRSHGGRLDLARGETPDFGGLLARLMLPQGRR